MDKFQKFRKKIWKYYRAHERNLPWRKTRDPYKILVSEIMLQQTQVERVVPKYREFLKRFPNLNALRKASLRNILVAWRGLGYNRRAVSLKKLSEIVFKKYRGEFPPDPFVLKSLPGIGEATAGAIAAFAFNIPAQFLETNIRRAFLHDFFLRRTRVSDKEILRVVRKTLVGQEPREWYYALMDYGAMLGKRRKNPNQRSNRYRRQPAFKGSMRELRGKIIKFLTVRNAVQTSALMRSLGGRETRIKSALRALEKDGLLTVRRGIARIA